MIRQGTTGRAATETERHEMETPKKRVEYLAREELSRKSLSYVATAAMAVFFGLVILPGFSATVMQLEESASGSGRLVDFFFLAIVSILSVNVFSQSYFLIHRDPFHDWLVFLRSLPVSPKEMVLARSLIMLPATLAMTALFFAPIIGSAWILTDGFEAGRFLWFALVWLGYALAVGGVNLYLELGVKGKLVLALQFVSLIAIIAVMSLVNGDLVLTTFELAGEYGPLAAGISLLIGGTLFALFAKATERRVEKREFVV